MRSCLIHAFAEVWVKNNKRHMKCRRCGLSVTKKIKLSQPTKEEASTPKVEKG